MDELEIAWLLPDGRVGGRTPAGTIVDVDRGIPGDSVSWKKVKWRGRILEGETVEITRPSPLRRPPPCPWTDRCGGCDLAEMDPGARREGLARMVGRAFGVEPVQLVPSPRQTGHRARIKLSIEGGKLGYHAARSHELIEIDQCPIARPELEAAMLRLRGLLPEDTTGLASVELRSDGQRVVASFVSEGRGFPEEKRAQLTAFGDVALDGKTLSGDPRLRIDVLGHALRASPLSFYQVNLEANQALVAAVLDGVAGAERVLDLYAGIGNLSIPLAARGVPVTAVELEGQATADLAANAAEAGLPVEVITGKVERFDPRRVAFDACVLDPPRAGAPGVLEGVLANRPKKLVYVACHAVNAARDLRTALDQGYEITKITAFDLFPDTHHVETVVHLERRGKPTKPMNPDAKPEKKHVGKPKSRR